MLPIKKENLIQYWKAAWQAFGLYLIWIVIHYVASHLYVRWCVPATLLGFLASPFLIPAPHCQALRWTIYNGGISISSMWVVFGMWLMNYLK